jgi:uncharacterized membrane protein
MRKEYVTFEGKVTTSARAYAKSWKTATEKIAKLFGEDVVCMGFDPSIALAVKYKDALGYDCLAASVTIPKLMSKKLLENCSKK